MKNITMHRFAAVNMNYQYYPFDYFLDAAEKNGVESIELYMGAPHFYVEDIHIGDAEKMKKTIQARGMKVISATPEGLFYPINVASENPFMRKRSIENMVKNIQVTSLLEIPQMLVLAGRAYYNQSIDEAWKRSEESLSFLAHIAEKEGVTLLLEPLQFEEANLVINIPSVKKMLQAVNSPNLKTMIDTVQMISAGETVEQYFAELGDNIRHVHFTEGSPAGHLTWGDGTLPMGELLQGFDKVNYHGMFSLEIGPYLTNPNKALEQGLNTIRRFLEDKL